MTVQVRAGLGEGRLVTAVESVLCRHPELRGDAARCFHRVEVGDPVAATPARLAEAGDRLESEEGLLQAVWLDAGPERSGRLLLVLHEQAGVSWQTLLPELVSGWTSSA
ncbi:hypothetical protein FKR81_17695 [Lentzea tibetensis]|uniref:Condensation domain-containing protein n=1 Tax=Lentzea tibetensis TaxID=2591470 RepID=A0A563ETD6_9PSEU|nr:hypothetical protein [Lentzea tibetensis]TWP50913.1 hypothetical protein FKR81_17695 [Lentzea tibetensis]